MKIERQELAEMYASALREHLQGEKEVTLERAYDLGRRGLEVGLGVVEMAQLHDEVLAEVLGAPPEAGRQASVNRAAQSFLLESLSTFEMAHREFRDVNAALRRWNERLEEEASRIAHALHDEAGQLLVSLHLALDELAREIGPAAKGRLKSIRNLLGGVEEQLRRLSHELRPTILDDLGLRPALEFLASGVSSRSGMAVSVEVATQERLPPRIETALYRVVQEALNNAARHSSARSARVRVRHEPGCVSCVVRDDGIGFDLKVVSAQAQHGGLGLVGMRERIHAAGGRLRVQSARGRGTELIATIPLEG